MSVDLLQPVILVVKAPNQQIADQTVECALDWTIRKLKDHLAHVYPSQPRQEQQKLIYYGRLLLDHLTLKDVLKQYEGQSTHTLHLVCAGCQNASPKMAHKTIPEVSSTEGLRHRTANQQRLSSDTSTTNATTTPPSSTNQNLDANQTPNPLSHPAYAAYYQQAYGQHTPTQNMAAGMPQMGMPQMGMPPMGMPQMGTPQMGMPNMAGMQQMNAQQQQQMMMYQQMYAQQMTQYMQYWQSMYQSPPGVAPVSPLAPMPTPESTPAAQGQGAPAGGAPAPPERPENPNMVMNAGAGGAAMFDDEDGGDQDWLDWFYMGCRFAVLVMIIHFYSTIPRAIVGVMFLFFIYVYQQGWFRRPVPAVVAIPAPAPPVPAQPAPAPAPTPAPEPAADEERQENPATEENSTPAAESDQTPSAENVSTNSATPDVIEPEEPGFSRLYVTWVFFKTFFTSLLPRPNAVI